METSVLKKSKIKYEDNEKKIDEIENKTISELITDKTETEKTETK